MSGGSFNYLYNKTEVSELLQEVDNMEQIRAELIVKGYLDVAEDVRSLLTRICIAKRDIEFMAKELSPVFKAVEFYCSADAGLEEISSAVEAYRKCKFPWC